MIEFRQANHVYTGMSNEEKEILVANIVESMMFVEKDVQKVVLRHFTQINEELGKKIEKRLNFNLQ